MSELPKLADIQVSIINYNAYVAEAKTLIRKMQGRLAWYDKLKDLTDYQQKSQQEATQIINVLAGFQLSTKNIINKLEAREADAWKTVVRNNEQHLEWCKVMQQKYKEKCQEADELREMLQTLIKDIAA
jgi:uncharacterized coiled-coil protein SlyX